MISAVSIAPRRQVTASQTPSAWHQVRWRILALLFLITVINFVDRQTLSIVAPTLRDTFHLSNTQYGMIGSAFMAGMLLGEFPMGLLMDRKGVGFGLSFAVIWWSIATSLHAAARSFVQFAAVRFWMGTGECGNFSGAMKTVSDWFPARERAFAAGVFNSGSMIGNVIAVPAVTFLLLHYGWQVSFLIPGILGILWVLLWRTGYRPLAKHPSVTEGERDLILSDRAAPVPPPSNRVLLARKETWALMLCRGLVGPVVQFYLLWTTEYLVRSRHLTMKEIGFIAWVPFLFGDIGSVGGGWLSGLLIRRGLSVTAARRAVMIGGAFLCLMSIAVARADTAPVAIGFICAVLLGHTALSANMFAAISDVFPASAVGRVTGLTGIAGGISGILFPSLTGFLVDHFSYTPPLFLAALLPAAGVIALFTTIGSLKQVQLDA
jgi:ACS family hexuronate transporter-like MFS transporter